MAKLDTSGVALRSDELAKIEAALGREPTVVELHAFDAQCLLDTTSGADDRVFANVKAVVCSPNIAKAMLSVVARDGVDGKEWVENDGGVQSLQMGSARLFWSRPLTVYLPYRWEKTAVKMALTPWEQFEEIDFDSKLLTWHQTVDK